MRRCLVVLLFGGASFAQTEATISGKITDATTHQPIAGARVDYCCFHRAPAVSDADGGYSFKVVLDDGGGVVGVRKSGYGRVDDVHLQPGGSQSRDIELQPAAHISGRIVDRDTGKPLGGFTVTARLAREVNGPFSVGPPAGADGSFEIGTDLKPGDYVLEVKPPARNRIVAGIAKASEQAAATQAYAPAWYPDVPREDMATPVMVAAGEKREVEIRIGKRALHRVAGVIQLPQGRENETVDVVLTAEDGSMIGHGLELKAGPFHLDGVDAGRYNVFATTDTGASLNETIEMTDRNIDDLKLTLRENVSLRAEVRMAEENVASPKGIEFIAVPVVRGEYVTEPSDKLRVDGMPPGRYWPVLITPPGYAVTEVSYAELPVVNAPVDVEAADSTVKFVVTSRPASVAGMVRDSDQKPLAGVKVVLLPEGTAEILDPGALRRLTTTSQANGAYRLTDLAPGRYSGFGQTLELDSGQNASLDLHVP